MGIKLGILGATGLIGRAMLKCLEETDISIDELRLFASRNHEPICFKDKYYPVIHATDDSFTGLTHLLSAVSADVILLYKDIILKNNIILIDNSSAFRHDSDVPLVIPEINKEDIKTHHGIISNPNCSTIITLIAIADLHRDIPIESLSVSTYQAVSGAGVNALNELQQQYINTVFNQPLHTEAFPYPIVDNLIPSIGSLNENGYTSEEMKMQKETRKILHHPSLKVNCTCVRVPVSRSHSMSVEITFKEEYDLEHVKKILKDTDGVYLCIEDELPMPLCTNKKTTVYVGRLRRNLIEPKRRLTLFCCGDQILRGAAYNAVKILEYLLEE